MKERSILTLALIGCLLLLTAADAQAGDKKRRGTAGSEQLLIPLTARTAALASAITGGIQDMNGLEALFANPAALSLNTGTSVLFSRMQYVADIGVNYFGIAQRFGNNNIALTVNAWDFGDIPLQTEALPDPSEVTWNATYVTAGLAYSREFTDRISAGVNAKVVSESIDDVRSTGMAFDAGMTYTVGESGLRFGVSLKNFGPSRQYSGTGMVRFVRLPGQTPDAQVNAVVIEGAEYEMPSLLNFGVSYSRELGAGAIATVLGNFRSNSFSQDQYGGGLELGFRNIFFLRGGYQYEQDMDLTMWGGANFGAGLNLGLGSERTLTVDYAYRATDFFDAVQMVTASFTL